MSNHLENLVGEWLEYKGYFVRKSVLVGKRALGGFEGELDVVGFHPAKKHLIHIECSLDAHPWPKREARFTAKFERGRKYVRELFHGTDADIDLDQIALMQLGGGGRVTLGGGRLVWVSDFIGDVIDDLALKSPDKQAVPSTLPLLRTLQLAAQRRSASRKSDARLLT